MTKEFKEFYNSPNININSKIMAHSANPNKFLALQYLIKRHEARGDQIIVFGDKPFILKEYAKRLKVPVGTGKVGSDERAVILEYFLKKKVKTIILSSIGDTAIDLPDASVVIQLSSFFSSRKQEAQRLGRILRPKDNDNS
jgi:DNA excision repair protein ERCC-3